jgi:rubrerythrin
MNRTGIATSPRQSSRMKEGAEGTVPTSSGDVEICALIRKDYAQRHDSVGSVPVPTTVRGLSQAVIQRLKGGRLEVLLDKLGERLSCERTSIRLYDLLLTKCEDRPDESGRVPLDLLRTFRAEELHHRAMLAGFIESLGADPTALTPSADVIGVATQGLLQALADPRTSVAQALVVMQLAELGDNDGWALLIRLAEDLSLSDMTNAFERAYVAEQRHLNELRDAVTETSH